MLPRDLGSIPVSATQANEAHWYWFVRLDFPAPTGSLRYTNHPAGDKSLNIDGSTQTWVGSDGSDLQVDRLDQSQQSILSVSAISLTNINDGTGPRFTILANTNWGDGTSGMRDKVVTIWQGWFDPDTGAFLGAIKLYEGTIDNHELGPRAMIALKPFVTLWARATPWAIPSPTCMYPYKDPLTCQYAGSEPVGESTCGKTRANCVARGNQARFGGCDLMPKPGDTVHWGGVQTSYGGTTSGGTWGTAPTAPPNGSGYPPRG